jgi:hypothetical protein
VWAAYEAGKAPMGIFMDPGLNGGGDLGQIRSAAMQETDQYYLDRIEGQDPGGEAQYAAASCGGMSFSAATKVLLASGAAIPISKLTPGDEVLATNVRTGKTSPEPVTAVLLHHDTDRYDLTVKTAHGTAVIDTTSSHLFWNPYPHYGWIPATHLKPGMHLKTPDGQTAVVVGGSVPAVHDGWMWDLTVPGNNDHDFYVAVAATAVLVHNCTAAEDAGDVADAATCGGMSFTAGTKVLLASGLAVPIASLKPGEKVLATNARSGKTSPEAVTAVLVHHDTNRYDLRVQTARGTAVIQSTTSHLFWDATSHQWVKAAALRYGSHLSTNGGASVTVLGGYVPADATGWMWDLTVANDHDFYIDTVSTAVLVHNCPIPGEGGTQVTSRTLMQNEDFHIDVENPNPGVRAGQLHLQDYVGNKYQYNFETGEFEGLPNSLAKQVAQNPAVARAIATGLRYLGMG